MNRFLIVILLIAILYNSRSRENESSAFSFSDNSLRIIAAGDIMAHMGQVKSALNSDGKTYDFNRSYNFVKSYIETADVAICNFESVLADKPFTGYPTFSSPDTLAYSVKYAGFDIAFTANNHCLDKGAQGLIKTAKKLLNVGLLTTGTFVDSNDKKHRNIIYINKNNIKAAFINYTQHTNGFKVKAPYIVNYIDKNEILESINKAKEQNSDAIIVFFHWGNEYKREPDKEQIEIAKFCYENGADIIIGSHPHVVQRIDKIKFQDKSGKYKDVLIAYSLGNLISNQSWRYSNGGIFLDFTIKRENGNILISKVDYKPVYVYREKAKLKKNYYLIFPDKIDDYQDNFKFSSQEIFKIKEFESDTKSLIGKIQ
jgi:poly-gamma-glutamate capsule biosynthesis protein CapA/YwtB (metallophosphatase superfamily)